MPRIARVVIPGCVHHVTQRGNNGQDVFFVDDDRRAYLDILQGQAARFGLTVQGYCLMTNHIHLLATPRQEDSLARALGRAHFHYTRYVNRLHGRTGHLWQNRFYSCALDEEHFWRALAYVERNPVRAHLVRLAWRYPWSSAAAHCGLDKAPAALLDLAAWPKMVPALSKGEAANKVPAPSKGEIGPQSRGRVPSANWDWSEALTQPGDPREVEQFKASTWAGRPLGSDSFLAKWETLLGRRLRALPRGRPRKQQPK